MIAQPHKSLGNSVLWMHAFAAHYLPKWDSWADTIEFFVLVVFFPLPHILSSHRKLTTAPLINEHSTDICASIICTAMQMRHLNHTFGIIILGICKRLKWISDMRLKVLQCSWQFHNRSIQRNSRHHFSASSANFFIPTLIQSSNLGVIERSQ